MMVLKDKFTLYRYINDILDFWTDENVDGVGEPLRVLNECLENACSFYTCFKHNFKNNITINHGSIKEINHDFPMVHFWNTVRIKNKDIIIDITAIYLKRLGMNTSFEYKENVDGFIGTGKKKYTKEEMVYINKNRIKMDIDMNDYKLCSVEEQKDLIDKFTKLYTDNLKIMKKELK